MSNDFALSFWLTQNIIYKIPKSPNQNKNTQYPIVFISKKQQKDLEF